MSIDVLPDYNQFGLRKNDSVSGVAVAGVTMQAADYITVGIKVFRRVGLTRRMYMFLEPVKVRIN